MSASLVCAGKPYVLHEDVHTELTNLYQYIFIYLVETMNLVLLSCQI